MTTTISSQPYVRKTSAQFTPMHGIGSCSAGKVRDWAGICFNKSEAKACLTCAPGSAAPPEKPEASGQVETKKGVEKSNTTAKDIGSQLQDMKHFFQSKEFNDKTLKQNCAKMSPSNEYGDCIRYGLAMREWKEKYGDNPTSPEALKHVPSMPLISSGSPPPLGYEKPEEFKSQKEQKFNSLTDLHNHLVKQKQQQDAIKWFDKEIEKPTATEGKKPKSTTTAKTSDNSARVKTNKEVEDTKGKQGQDFGNLLAHPLASHAKANKEVKKPAAAEDVKSNSTDAENPEH